MVIAGVHFFHRQNFPSPTTARLSTRPSANIPASSRRCMARDNCSECQRTAAAASNEPSAAVPGEESRSFRSISSQSRGPRTRLRLSPVSGIPALPFVILLIIPRQELVPVVNYRIALKPRRSKWANKAWDGSGNNSASLADIPSPLRKSHSGCRQSLPWRYSRSSGLTISRVSSSWQRRNVNHWLPSGISGVTRVLRTSWITEGSSCSIAR
jgi:hypothetical protein